MNILIAAPSDNFDISKIKQLINHDVNFYNDQIYYSNDLLTAKNLKIIDIVVGNDQNLVDTILAQPTSQLRWVQALSAGIDYLPLQKLRQKNILLTTLKGLHAEPIAETILGMILSNYRALNFAVQNQKWQKPQHVSKMIKNKKVVIFGTGNIGSRTAQLLQVFTNQIIGINHNGHPATNFSQTFSTDTSTKIASTADIIINTMPLTSITKNFFNAKFFNQLKQQPLFISVGRGPSTNTQDLITALKQHQLSGAALDVADPEPLPNDNPLWAMDNVLITPHISGIYSEYTEEAIHLFSKNLQQFKKNGTVLINQADLNIGY